MRTKDEVLADIRKLYEELGRTVAASEVPELKDATREPTVEVKAAVRELVVPTRRKKRK